MRERVDEAYKAEDEWPDAVRAGIDAMLVFLASEPNLARLAMVEALVAGPVVVERYDAAVQTFLPYIAAGRKGASKTVLKHLSDSTEEALVGGMVSLVSRRIVAGQTEELESLLPDLTEFTLTPFVGSDKAAASPAATSLPRPRGRPSRCRGKGDRTHPRRPKLCPAGATARSSATACSRLRRGDAAGPARARRPAASG